MGTSLRRTPKYRSCSLNTHKICAQHEAAVTYSASTVERATEIFASSRPMKLIRQGPKKVAMPDVLFLSTKTHA